MSGARILVSASPGEVRVALLRGDRLDEAWVERPARPDGVGDLQRARVTALAPAMAGAFLALAGGESGFLPESEASVGAVPVRQPIGKSVSEGQVLVVRVTRASQGGKGARLSARVPPEALAPLVLPPGNAPALLARGPEAALRLARAVPEAMVLTDGAAVAARLRGLLGAARVGFSPRPVFDEALETEFDLLAGPEVPLEGGGRILVHPTPAFTAIDVDAGSAAGERDVLAQTRVNEAAVLAAARQIRLRQLAGPILLDLAGMTAKRRAALAEPLTRALAPDHLARLLGLGPLGLFEILRQRVHPPLHEVLAGPLTPGLAALRQVLREAAAAPGRRLALRAAPAVLAALAEGSLGEAAAALGQPLALRPEPGLGWGDWRIEEAGDGG